MSTLKSKKTTTFQILAYQVIESNVEDVSEMWL